VLLGPARGVASPRTFAARRRHSSSVVGRSRAAGTVGRVEGGEVVAIVGPTATGKSDLGIAVAEAVGAEVVNADAMQLYRGMDIGTAKVPPAARRGVPHHQIDVLDVTDDASVAAYQRAARGDLARIHRRGARPLLVGGSGLYVSAVLDDLDFPGTEPDLRAELLARAQEEGVASLHRELASLDPPAAAAIDPANTRRIVRALEVVRLTGRPFTARLPLGAGAVPAVRIGLQADRSVLDERVAARAKAMFEAGLVEETRTLLDEHGRFSRTASRAVGYAQALDVLAGRLSEGEAVESTILATRRLVRRQEKWFLRDPGIVWLDATADPEHLLRSVLRTLNR
jgi:tRNA dimethylallyltransferase